VFGARGTGVGEGLEEWMRDGRESESQGEGGRDGMSFLGCNLFVLNSVPFLLAVI